MNENTQKYAKELERLNRRLDGVLWYLGRQQSTLDIFLKRLTKEISQMAGELDTLTREVTESTTVQQGAVVLLGQLGDLIRAAANDPAKILALAAQLDANETALAAAIVANTPAESQPPVPE